MVPPMWLPRVIYPNEITWEAVPVWVKKPTHKDTENRIQEVFASRLSQLPQAQLIVSQEKIKGIKKRVEDHIEKKTYRIFGFEFPLPKIFKTVMTYMATRKYRDILKSIGNKINNKTPTEEEVTKELIEAVRHNDIESVKLMLKHGATVPSSGLLLFWAVHHGNVEMAALLIDKGVDVNALDFSKSTPLLKAAESGKCEMAKLLIENGADVNAQDNLGKTPLHHVLSADHINIELLRLLVSRNADKTIRDVFGETAQKSTKSLGYSQDSEAWKILHPEQE